ncbi:uncharacterized protein LOC132639488 [Lycium barbarum]|uniref:uncharacterized protein LOC132639488 n=1 Tax=Lycium barbarum TaxID=112863 RepID=UPI00293EE22F|nr:uncharacterized protein LOC132639488 [Lycium barbarum]
MSTPYHPSANGQVESTIKTIIQNLRKRLDESKGRWKEILPEVLWAYKTTSKSSTDETPFFLVYGAEALIPIEVGEPSLRFQYAIEESNEEAIAVKIDLMEELREAALVYLAAQKQRMDRSKAQMKLGRLELDVKTRVTLFFP